MIIPQLEAAPLLPDPLFRISVLLRATISHPLAQRAGTMACLHHWCLYLSAIKHALRTRPCIEPVEWLGWRTRDLKHMYAGVEEG